MINQGALPFKGKNIQLLFLNIQKGYYAPVKNVNHYNNQLVSLINKCLQTRPSKRPTLKEILTTPIIVKYIRQEMLTLSPTTGELILAPNQVEDTVLEGEMSNLVLQLSELGILSSRVCNSEPQSPLPSIPSQISPQIPNPQHFVAKKAGPIISSSRSSTPGSPALEKPAEKAVPLKVMPNSKPVIPSKPSGQNLDSAQKARKITSEISKLHKEQQRIEKILDQMRRDKENKEEEQKKQRKEEEDSFKEFSRKFQNLNLPSKFDSKPVLTNQDRVLFEKQQRKEQEEMEQKQKLKEARIEYHNSKVQAKNQEYNQYHNTSKVLDTSPKDPPKKDVDLRILNEREMILKRQAEIDQEIENEYAEMIQITSRKIETLQKRKEHILEPSKEPLQDTMFGDSDESTSERSFDSSEGEIEYEIESSDIEDEENYYEEEQEFYDDIPVAGRLEDRVNKLISQSQDAFGKERFEKLYARYKEIYNNDQIQNEEAKIGPRTEILGADEPKLRRYCHLIEELIFVESALM